MMKNNVGSGFSKSTTILIFQLSDEVVPFESGAIGWCEGKANVVDFTINMTMEEKQLPKRCFKLIYSVINASTFLLKNNIQYL